MIELIKKEIAELEIIGNHENYKLELIKLLNSLEKTND